jgi:hypothetical protein
VIVASGSNPQFVSIILSVVSNEQNLGINLVIGVMICECCP